MKKFFKKIQTFFIHLFGGVTPTYVRETLSDMSARHSFETHVLSERLQKTEKELEQTKEELEKYKNEHTYFSATYVDTPLTVEYTQICSKDRLPDEDELDNLMHEHLIDLMAKSNEFKQCIKIIKKYNPVNNTNIYKGVARIVNLNKDIYVRLN